MFDAKISNEEFVETVYRRLLLRDADAGGRQHYLSALAAGNSRFEVIQSLVTSGEYFDLLCQQRFGPQTGSPFLKAVPPAHFYSPLPSMDAVDALAGEAETFDAARCPGIDIRVTEQLALLGELAPHVSGLHISDAPAPGHRYHADNGSFAPGDALLLAAILMWAQPARILEIGAGFSTALMLDVIEERLPGQVSLESVDPEPGRIRSLLRPGDEHRFHLREGLVQDLSAADFASLRSNDILFIDSSHVMKLGSDVTFLLGQVLPTLSPGVLIHIHDIAWPFEYPVDHYRAGWAWNEAHAVRLLLTDSPRYEILAFADYLVRAQREHVRQVLPQFLRQRPGVPADGNSACSLWLRIAAH